MTRRLAIVIFAAAGMAVVSPGWAQSPAFEVVSIKPNHAGEGMMIRRLPGGKLSASNIPVKSLLQEAYGVKESQISGGPGWIDSERYDIEAKPDDAFADAEKKLSRDEMIAQQRLMMQAMLADRFKLTLHHESKEMEVYALVVAKNGPKLHEVTLPPPETPRELPKPGDPLPKGGIWMRGRGQLDVTGAGMAQFVNVLSMQVGRIVLDKTALKGNYEFTLKWTPDEGQGHMPGGPPGDAAPPPDASGPSIFTALQEQLGLKLESQKGAVDTLVIDHVERPSEN
jgi:uncharacterized protein (TIGR03435 family)